MSAAALGWRWLAVVDDDDNTFTQFEPDYIVVVNSCYPDGGSEIKETSPAKGKAPEWNQTIEFDVTNRPVKRKFIYFYFSRVGLYSSFSLFILFKKTKTEGDK
jgi:hypothetical protein